MKPPAPSAIAWSEPFKATPRHAERLPESRRSCISLKVAKPSRIGEPAIAHCSVEHWNFWGHQSADCDCAGAEAARTHAGDGAAQRLPAEDRAAGSGVSRAAAGHRPYKLKARGDGLRRKEGNGDGAAGVSVSGAAADVRRSAGCSDKAVRAQTCCCWAS